MIRIIITTAIVVVLFTGCAIQEKNDATESDSVSSPVRIKVETAYAVRNEIQKKRSFTGVLEPLKQVNLAPAVQSAVIRTIKVDIGDRVKKGQLLAKLDDAQLATTRTQFELVKNQYERTQRLFKNNAASKTQYDQIETEFLSLKRRLEQIEENTFIHAPFSGVVTGKYFEEGELYTPSMITGLLQITQLDPLKLDLDMDESSVSHVKKGQKVNVKIGALSDSIFGGVIQWINPSADPVSHTFNVRITVPNNNDILKAGYFAEVYIIIDKKEDVVSVPIEAVVGKKIYVIENDNLAIAKDVVTGWKTSESIEIISGIKEGDMIVISGNKALPDSSFVDIITGQKKYPIDESLN